MRNKWTYIYLYEGSAPEKKGTHCYNYLILLLLPLLHIPRQGQQFRNILLYLCMVAAIE